VIKRWILLDKYIFNVRISISAHSLFISHYFNSFFNSVFFQSQSSFESTYHFNRVNSLVSFNFRVCLSWYRWYNFNQFDFIMFRQYSKQFKSSIKKKFVDDSNDLLMLNICKTQYDVVLLTNDDNYVDIVNSIEDVTSKLTSKISLIIISNWKSYVQISLYVQSNNVKYDQSRDFRNFIELHETHAYFDADIIQNSELNEINQQSNLLNLAQEKLFRDDLSRKLIYQMTIKYDSNLIRQCEFLFDQIYSMLNQAQNLILHSRDQILRLMISTNSHVTIVLNEFFEKLQINVFDYSTFYSRHSRFHFLQLKDYFASESRSIMHVLVSFILNIWSKYITIYEYDAIYEHKIVVNAHVEITQSEFQLRVMNVLDSQNIYFVEFLKKFDELNVRFNIENVLKIYFDFETRMNVENWIVVMIEFLSCASQKDVCISLFKKRDTKTNQYDDWDLNSLSINIIEITKTFEQIFRHFVHSIAIDYDLRDKIFRHQIVDLHKLYFNEECRWWKKHLLDKNMRFSFHVDVYKRCHFTIMSLLNVAHLNEAQRRDVNHVKRFFNEIDFIIKSTTTRKITFVIIIVQSFL
jgi:hypothetical protein